MMKDGRGVILRKPGCATEWELASDSPSESVSAFVSDGTSRRRIGTYRVEDDTLHGVLRIFSDTDTGTSVETVRYDIDTGRRL